MDEEAGFLFFVQGFIWGAGKIFDLSLALKNAKIWK